MERQILHIDVNNAFLSWTAVDMLKKGATLDIRTIPAIIGGDENQRRGIVLAKSMPAKQFGIRTGEPIYFARKKCPNIQLYASDFSIYNHYSRKMKEIFLEYTDQIERFSIDECFLDLTHFLRLGETLLQKAYEIKDRIYQELGFTVNIGVSHNKLLTKMASDFEKPNKVHTLYPEEVSKKMWPLPVADLFMVGKKTLPKLEKMHIKTIGDLAKTEEQKLLQLFGKHGKMMYEYANGIDYSPVNAEEEQPKCIGNSITLPEDIEDIEKLTEIILALSEQVGYRLRKHQLLAKVVGVQIKTKDFQNFSHQKKVDVPTNSTKEIYSLAKELLQELHKGREVRLIGLRVDNLCNKKEIQLSLFDVEKNEKQEKLDTTIDQLKQKYGYNTVTRAGKMKINDIINLKGEKK